MTAQGGVRPVLRQVLDAATTGPSAARVARALGLLVEELDLDLAYVAEVDDASRLVVTHTVQAPSCGDSCALLASGECEALAHRILTGADPTGVLPVVGTYAGVPLVEDGTVVGVLCCVTSVATPLRARDLGTVQTVADHVAPLLAPVSPVSPEDVVPAAPVAGTELERVAQAVVDGQSLEQLSRPLLEMLRVATGLDSTYLTAIDWEADEQRIVYSRNGAELQIPEGAAFDWSDTLCRRSLDAGRPYTTDVPSVWGDSVAAAALGITTYVSFPVLDPDANVIGSLCGTSTRAVDVDPRHLTTMRMFAALIGQQIATQARATAQLQRALALQSRLTEVDDLALRDPLTGLLNRRGIERWLATASADLRPGLEQMAVGFCDLDDFKGVNDTLGHAAGDEALRSFAAAVRVVGREGDLQGRLGGDEFVVAAVLPAGAVALGAWVNRLRRAATATVLIGASPHEVRASVGVAAFTAATTPEEALSAADTAMYLEKASHRVAR